MTQDNDKEMDIISCEHGFIAGCPECSRPSVAFKASFGKRIEWAVCAISDRGEPYVASAPGWPEAIFPDRRRAEEWRATYKHRFKGPLYLGKVTTTIELDAPTH